MRVQQVWDALREFAKLVPTMYQTIGTNSALLSVWDGLFERFDDGLLVEARLDVQVRGARLPKPYVPSPYK